MLDYPTMSYKSVVEYSMATGLHGTRLGVHWVVSIVREKYHASHEHRLGVRVKARRLTTELLVRSRDEFFANVLSISDMRPSDHLFFFAAG